MPPRPQSQPVRSGRKPSTANILKADKDANAMPPPPIPTAPKAILEPEMEALSGHLKSAMVKTGLVYGFSSDTRRLGIQQYTPNPPSSLTSALGRDVEKYDQLCDAMESQLLRAIAILERDLKREEQRVKEAEEAAKASEMQAEPSMAPIPPTSDSSEAIANAPSSASPTSSIPGRRPSAISISSLHRPAFPLKLDLSAASLRLSPEEASTFGIPDGLQSPVTLAPKSARPQDYPQDLLDMAALASAQPQPEASTSSRVDIDLTLPDPPSSLTSALPLDSSMGTADKPIELDLDSMDIDMNDLFGDETAGGDDLFSPALTTNASLADASSTSAAEVVTKEGENFLNSLGAGSGGDDLFASAQTSQPAVGSTLPAPSPGTLLASFAAGAPESGALPPADNQFGLDGMDYNFFGDGNGEDASMNNLTMDQLLGSIQGAQQPQAPPKAG